MLEATNKKIKNKKAYEKYVLEQIATLNARFDNLARALAELHISVEWLNSIGGKR